MSVSSTVKRQKRAACCGRAFSSFSCSFRFSSTVLIDAFSTSQHAHFIERRWMGAEDDQRDGTYPLPPAFPLWC
jgi:hypothetical protein